MTRTDTRWVAAILIMALPLAAALDAQVPPGASAAARAIAMRTTTSAARTVSALSSLSSNAAGASSRAASIMGYLWVGEGTAVENAKVQLRNLVTGQVEQVSTTLQNGAFSFTNVPGGTYAIEYVSDVAGKVVSIGQALSVAPGEAVATFVRLGSNLAGILPNLAANAAQTVISNAAQAVASGVVSVAGTVAPPQPASPVQ